MLLLQLVRIRTLACSEDDNHYGGGCGCGDSAPTAAVERVVEVWQL
jgi:hypothetical protein